MRELDNITNILLKFNTLSRCNRLDVIHNEMVFWYFVFADGLFEVLRASSRFVTTLTASFDGFAYVWIVHHAYKIVFHV